MSALERPRPLAVTLFGAAALALSAVAGVGFALWWNYGERMLLAIVENGLAWCY